MRCAGGRPCSSHALPWWDHPSSFDVNPTGVSGSRNGNGNGNGGRGSWRGAPKSRSGAGTPLRGTDSPRRGGSTARGRGRGRGWGRGWGPDDVGDSFGGSRRPRFGVGGKARPTIGKDAPLSDLLYSERPLLRPVKFVRATLTPFLFQHSEDVLKPAAQVAGVWGFLVWMRWGAMADRSRCC